MQQPDRELDMQFFEQSGDVKASCSHRIRRPMSPMPLKLPMLRSPGQATPVVNRTFRRGKVQIAARSVPTREEAVIYLDTASTAGRCASAGPAGSNRPSVRVTGRTSPSCADEPSLPFDSGDDVSVNRCLISRAHCTSSTPRKARRPVRPPSGF